METERLRHLTSFARAGGVRDAARELGISPSVVSKSLRQLEAELGTSLVVRTGRTLALTSHGRQAVRHAERVLRDVATLRHDLHHAARSESPPDLRIATFGPFASLLLAQVVDRIPDAGAVFHHAEPGRLERLVALDEADVGITLLPMATAGIVHVPVAELEFAAYARTARFTGTGFGDTPFVAPAMPLPGAIEGTSGDGWPDGRLPRRIRHRVSMFDAVLQLAAHGHAAACLPTFAVRLHNDAVRPRQRLEPLAVPGGAPRIQRTCCLAIRTGEEHARPVTQLAHVLSAILAP